MKLYPLVLEPIIKDYLWGGTRLKDEFGFKTEKEVAAEGWMLACHKDGTNIVSNGELAGKRLDEVLKIWGFSETLPILVKLIDANQKLSVQVHPDNAYALEKEGEFGKTEMWYVVDCVEGAKIAYGFKKIVDKAEFKKRIEENTLDEVINYVPVEKGDMFFISAGTLHAIGEGILIAEIQQNSNTTYRVSDYGRLGADGKPRELHISKALDVTTTHPPILQYGQVGSLKEFNYGVERQLADCDFFKVLKIDLNGTKNICNTNSMTSILILDGELTVVYKDERFCVFKGDSVLIPINLNVDLIGKAEVLCSTY